MFNKKLFAVLAITALIGAGLEAGEPHRGGRGGRGGRSRGGAGRDAAKAKAEAAAKKAEAEAAVQAQLAAKLGTGGGPAAPAPAPAALDAGHPSAAQLAALLKKAQGATALQEELAALRAEKEGLVSRLTASEEAAGNWAEAVDIAGAYAADTGKTSPRSTMRKLAGLRIEDAEKAKRKLAEKEGMLETLRGDSAARQEEVLEARRAAESANLLSRQLMEAISAAHAKASAGEES